MGVSHGIKDEYKLPREQHQMTGARSGGGELVMSNTLQPVQLNNVVLDDTIMQVHVMVT